MGKPGTILFQRRMEPKENAFQFLTPQGWLVEGGIYRANLMGQMINAQSIEAKLDFSLKSNPVGTVMMRWGPEIKYCDTRYSPAGMMGLFQPGSNYQGMVVWPLTPAVQFLIQVVFPWAHPQAVQPQVIDQRNEPTMTERQQRHTQAMGLPFNPGYDGGSVTFTYIENGIRYKEQAFTVIENLGAVAGGMWSNKDTILMRTPLDEFEDWRPVFSCILNSVQINPAWFQREAMNQGMLSHMFLQSQQAQMSRDQQMLQVQRQLQQIDHEIVEHRQRMNAEIQHDQYLTLMAQEEYANPYTGNTDVGSNEWLNRWVTESGEVFYSDNSYDDPNLAGVSNRYDWVRTPVRKRFE